MKKVSCWNDLVPYGIDPLTGEACGLMWRILCDVTTQGKKTLEKCFGIPSLNLPGNWNRGDNDDPLGEHRNQAGDGKEDASDAVSDEAHFVLRHRHSPVRAKKGPQVSPNHLRPSCPPK